MANNHIVYRMQGPAIVEESDIEAFREDILNEIHGNPGIKLAVDFSELRVISSRALGVLVAIRKEVKQVKGHMVLFGITPPIEKVMNVTRMHTLFSIYDNEEDAHTALSMPPALPFWQVS